MELAKTEGRLRLLLVDDDEGLRALLRTTFEVVDIEVDEAESAAVAEERIAVVRPDVIVLDVLMPGIDGLEFCRRLKQDPATREIPVVLLTGSEGGTLVATDAAGADAFVKKPFSPLELLGVVERLAGGLYGVPFRAGKKKDPEEQLLLYARDLRHLLEVERGQRIALQEAYRETVAALATALETKDTGTRAHSQRVQQYALELCRAIAPDLGEEPSVEYGFLLHDVGKIGIPDEVLRKPGPLTEEERRLMQKHTVIGEQMLGGVAFLQGPGLSVVRSHHERWDGGGYPDGLSRDEVPLGARVFAVADTLDAMTSDRVYRPAGPWQNAREEIVRQRGQQFDPDVVDAFRARERELRAIHRAFAAA
jgi:response regulator RpfG family c-di-GMP phosphodiesterase